MNLKELSLEEVYTSRRDLHLVNDFFIPCLSNSNKYDRLSGYFSSNIFFIIFEGIKKFVDNGGVIRLILGTLPDKEIEILNNETLCNVLLKDFYDDLKNIDKLKNGDHLKLLAWMVKNRRISIRIAIILNEDKEIGSREDIIKAYRNGIMHQKIGIFHDDKGNTVTFSGSVNETFSGWVKNSEEFKVFTNWDGSKIWFSDYRKFERYWRKKEPTLKIIPLPDKILEELENNAPEKLKPETFESIDVFCKNMRKIEDKESDDIEIKETEDWKLDSDGTPKIERFSFWDHQISAVSEWVKNNFKGILKMATGSGKTYTAIKCAYELNRLFENLLIIVLVPTKYLIEQWKGDVSKFSKNYISISSETKEDWRDAIAHFPDTKKLDHFFLISTVKLFYLHLADYLSNNKILEKMKVLLIADEVHTMGQNKIKNKLKEIPKINNVLGLSATPQRYFDKIGSEFIFDYFGKIIKKYSIHDGQNDGHLAKYHYHLFFCSFNKKEYKDYQRITKEMGKYNSDDEEARKTFKDMATARARILKQCASKLNTLEAIIQDIKKKKRTFHLVIYGYKIEQLRRIREILKKHNLDGEYFIGSTPTDDRKILLKNSDKKRINALLAVKCLNEGIDLPSLSVGIVISNSKNPIESIQRRGRLLRAPKNKPDVLIYDYLVFPPSGEKSDKDLIENQLERIGYFIRDAINYNEQERVIYEKTELFLPKYDDI